MSCSSAYHRSTAIQSQDGQVQGPGHRRIRIHIIVTQRELGDSDYQNPSKRKGGNKYMSRGCSPYLVRFGCQNASVESRRLDGYTAMESHAGRNR